MYIIKKNIISLFLIVLGITSLQAQENNCEYSVNNDVNPPRHRYESHFISMKRTRLLPKTVIENQAISQSQLALGYKIDKTSDFERRYVLNVLTYILGGGSDSKLFKEVREKNSLCYSITSIGLKLLILIVLKNLKIIHKTYLACIQELNI